MIDLIIMKTRKICMLTPIIYLMSCLESSPIQVASQVSGKDTTVDTTKSIGNKIPDTNLVERHNYYDCFPNCGMHPLRSFSKLKYRYIDYGTLRFFTYKIDIENDSVILSQLDSNQKVEYSYKSKKEDFYSSKCPIQEFAMWSTITDPTMRKVKINGDTLMMLLKQKSRGGVGDEIVWIQTYGLIHDYWSSYSVHNPSGFGHYLVEINDEKYEPRIDTLEYLE